MKSMNHPNIIKHFHVIETEEITYLVMEHASEGELLRRILERGSLPECEAERIFTQVVHAVNYCHNNQVVHRDIKATNILMDCRGNAKLIDFSLAVKVTPGQKLRGFCGTLPYCAPELFAPGEYDAYPIDMWCLGILLFLMHVSIDIFNVILELLIINPGRRPTIKDIMRRPMIRASEARSPPTSTPSLPGTPSPSIVGTMRVMGYKPEVIIESLRVQKYDEVMATYLILQHQSPAGDYGHNQVNPVKTRQPGTVLRLTEPYSYPGSLRRAEPVPYTFTLPSKGQEKEEEHYSRKFARCHSMPATLCCHPDTHPLHLGCPIAKSIKSSILEMNIYFSQVGSRDSHTDSDHISLGLYTNSSRTSQNEGTSDLESHMSYSHQSESWSFLEEEDSSSSSSEDLSEMTTVIEIESTIVPEEKTLTQEDIDAQEAIIALRVNIKEATMPEVREEEETEE
ncbi:sperm motility kinase X-like [Meriones unguiculatus]|uniref:sperm motility kinase X-like n=1 Tax=Meriones unguiculatus TaxID=10047 RepID=UPI00293ED021|nr:sperm motility kinase X-like [Meriones unguiculatus]